MSTKHVRSAADLVRFNCGLQIDCAGCGHSRTLGGFDVAKAFGTGTFAQIRRPMKCSRCRVKNAG